MTSLFRQILTMSLSAGFLVGIVAGFRWCFRRVPKWVLCILWGLVAIRLVCPSLPESHYSMVPEQVSDSEVIVEIVRDLPRPAPMEQAAAPKPEFPAEGTPEKVYAPAASKEVPVQEEIPSPAPIPWMTVLAWVWVAGMAVMGLYAFLSTRKILNLVGPSVNIGNSVYLCDYIDSPFLLGFRRPRIYLPSHLDAQTAEYVLSHERSHIRRRDHWWKPIGFILLSVHWFNPMIWMGYILLCRDIEMACDEAVIRAMDEAGKKGYSTALLTCSLPRSTVSICPLAFGEVSVKERIRSVLNYRKPALWLSLVGVAAVMLGAVFFLTNPMGKIAPEDAEYLITASYDADKDILTTFEYDKEFRPSRELIYGNGSEVFRQEHVYKRQGNTLTHTVICTCSDRGISAPVYLEDAISFSPGDTATMVYTETLDQNDNVLESVLTVDGEWVCTRTYTYDESGNRIQEVMDSLTAKTGEQRSQKTTFVYDDQGNLVHQKIEGENSNTGSYSIEDKWERDENGNSLRYQNLYNTKLVADKQFVLDVRGNPRLKSSLQSDGTTVTYTTRRDVENCRREAVIGTDRNSNQLSSVINFYDERDNLLTAYDVKDNTTLNTAYNYIGTDGFKSTGIPEEIYTEGKPVHANPKPYVLDEPVPYYPTAKYEQDSDTLTVYDYDREFHLKEKSTYVGGYETGRKSYQFVTVEDDSRDITDLTPAYSTRDYVVYHQRNSKGQITQSIRYAKGGIWESTHRYSYDAFGKLECVEGASPQRIWKIFYTPEELMNECCHLWIRDVAVEGPAISETDFPINDRTEKMLLPDILEETGLYSHETDEIILAQEPIQYDAYGFDHSYGKINLNATLDGKLVFGQSNTLDSKGNVLNSNLGDGTGNHITYFNYVSRDGHESRGIPERIYPADFQAKEKASYPSARYDSETGQLTKFEYDKNYQLTGASVWKDGVEISKSDYHCKTKGNTLTITEEKAEDGKKTELIYTKELDENGRVVKSTCCRDGAWDSTYLYKYFPGGGINMVVGYNSRIGFRLLNDQFGQKTRYRTGAFTEADVPEEPVWLEIPAMQKDISEKWYLPGFIDDKLYFHELDDHLLALGERHDDEYSWNGGGFNGDGDGNKYTDVQIRRWEDSSLAEGQTIYMTAEDDPLWKNITDNEWCAFENKVYTYYNYICTDGTKKAAIPEDLYYDAAGEWLTPYSYTPQEKSGKTMDYVELEKSKFWFDPSIPETERQDCISATNRINNAIWGNYDLSVCVLTGKDLDKPYIEGSTLYTTVRDFRSREYTADVICAANGEYTLYGLAYGYANFLCDKLGWQEAENTEFVMPQNMEAADLNALCFDGRYSSQEDIAAAKQLACWFANTFLLREDKNNYHIRFWMSNDPSDMNEYVCNELEKYYAEMGLDYRPTQVLYARGGNGLDYTANVSGEIIPVKMGQSPSKDYAGVRAYFEEKLPRDLRTAEH